MGLEEKSIEDLPDRCEECGAKLTTDEQRAVLENGGPVLCKIHAAEVLPDPAEDDPPSG